jgi:enterochelin esterase-like enzyme
MLACALVIVLAVPVLEAFPQAKSVRRPLPEAGIAAGRVEEVTLHDSAYGRARRIWVYTPAGYDPARAYPLLLAFDGRDYLDTIPLPLILDTLIAGGHTPAFVAVLVDDSSSAVRLADLANEPRMITFLDAQLLPWVRGRYRVTTDPARRIITGSSAGGLAAAYVAFSRPDLFENVLSQSGAFWRGSPAGEPYEALPARIAAAPPKPVTFLLDVGAGEDHRTLGGGGPNFLDATRRFRDALHARGYPIIYTEIPGGVHAPSTWRTRLPSGIVALTSRWSR